jgi:hypothetical protein
LYQKKQALTVIFINDTVKNEKKYVGYCQYSKLLRARKGAFPNNGYGRCFHGAVTRREDGL